MITEDRNIEKATKVEEVVLTKRGRRYGVLALAILGVLSEVNPSNSKIYALGEMITQSIFSILGG